MIGKNYYIYVLALFVLATIFLFGLKEEKNFENMTTIEEIEARISGIGIKNENRGFWWNSGDGYNIFVPADESVTIIKTGVAPVERDLVARKYFDEEGSLADLVLMNRHFIFNIENSSTSTSDKKFYDYVQSYENGDEKCSVIVNPDFMSYPKIIDMGYSMSVVCGNDFEKAKDEQAPLIDSLGLKNTKNVVILKNRMGDFLKVGISSVRSGGYAILKKEGENYRVLFKGQEDPFCNLIKEENIPENILKSFGINGCFIDGAEHKFFE
ncbi:TPA: hypothetical protein DCZ46_04080 [Candidatus Campbellbacteria bacterium]|nr:MAG: protein of unknown function with transmembrane region [Candidatus Campbellbacteria bacterium GW2011_OD1_34_28]KKP75014.1 MAG: hypothetical protein UR74_C0002G0280 [Candidatus Campbellbacteria bacterium GW2011_GWD2_35_24]KKP75900.1 MAG: hypothetical protein UR75_C0002G0281 [Candidatus Campbellbacteria bacterium GW2011_GWC2_35_28]KKP76852.1 MAG: hypothetical protein UR76_C0002G0053 [Candidatus Campbellbacteria bacterium GW2011_GWC1_35_31]KKP78778.1 MAG: hypothetical protein UR79_C0002G005